MLVYYFSLFYASACKYTLLFIIILFCRFLWTSHLYIWPVQFPGGEHRTWHGLYYCMCSFSHSLPHSWLFLFIIFNIIILMDHMYKGSFVTSVCIGKRKILLLRPTQWKYLSVYRLHHIVRWSCFYFASLL